MKKDLQKNSHILNEVKELIEESKIQVSIAVNSTMSMLYWEIGYRINKKAEYGKKIVDILAKLLTLEYGCGFTVKNIRRMMQFLHLYPKKEIVASLIRQLEQK